ncbi:MAG: SufD family Fe-S cluster assembly protein [Clostridia bacterium]|nr:SufD family Fe-S cluster assembly protein [Clostridia bacterium]
MILNQTPIRTSKNYKINNIELDKEMPKKQEEFEGLTISGDTSNFKISNSTSKKPLIYGNGKELENQIFENANQNIKIEETKTGSLYLDFNLNEENFTLVENIEIEANTKSKTTIYIKYMSDDNFKCFHNGILRVNAKNNSKTNIVIINMLNDFTTNLLSIENILEESSNVNYTIVDFGGKTSVTNYYSRLKGKGAKANINTIYLGKDDQVFDINYIAELFGENTEVGIEVQGALKDEAKKNFKGTIDFKKGSKKAKGDENEFCMLLSDKAKSKALPMLLCTEEDVEGNHSSSAGKIEDDKLFYIMSRGLSEKDAMKLVVKAKFNKILETIKDEDLKEEIVEEIDKRLD